jgi:hypothetical protein
MLRLPIRTLALGAALFIPGLGSALAQDVLPPPPPLDWDGDGRPLDEVRPLDLDRDGVPLDEALRPIDLDRDGVPFDEALRPIDMDRDGVPFDNAVRPVVRWFRPFDWDGDGRRLEIFRFRY